MKFKELYTKEDWLAIWIGFILLGMASVLPMFPKIEKWDFQHLEFYSFENFLNIAIVFSVMVILFLLAVFFQKKNIKQFFFSFFSLFLLALMAQYLSAFSLSKSYGFGYAFWALFIGLFISNVIGIKKTILKTLQSELIIKTGLVLLGGEILFSKMMFLGLPALTVAWVVTPIVIIFMYYFGVKYLKIDDKLSIVIATATSVCGVSAAIACSSACKAKKETLTLAVSMTLIFTVIMMIVMPAIVQLLNLDPLVGGAWIGGTIDSTGAVVAAGAVLGQEAMDVAAIVKMIQNIMVGVVAFIVAIVWAKDGNNGQAVSISDIWMRFPKFILGFITASIVFSFVIYPAYGEDVVNEILEVSKSYRGLLFTLAFLAIGLESNFKELANHVQNGKPIYLYIVGQSFNIVLTLFVAYLAFGGVIFENFR
jgi:uncharacterized integral membrane protein (TIGR00698 family)